MKTDFEGADRKMTEAQRFKELIQEAYPRTYAVANATARLDEYPFDQDIRYRLRHLLREEDAAWTRVRRCRAVAIHDELLRCAVVADEVCAGSRGTACEAEAVRAARAAWDAYDRARKAMGLGLGVVAVLHRATST